MKNNKGFSTIVSVLIVLGLFIAVGVAYKIGKNNSVPTNVNQENTNSNVVENNEQNENEEVPVIIKTPLSTTLPAPYISAQENWPPVVKASSENYSCTLSHSELGDTIKKIINGKEYCVTKLTEGAAGSSYSTYTYKTFGGQGSSKSTTFILRYANCGVYGDSTDPTVISCKSNQATFTNNLDGLIDSLM